MKMNTFRWILYSILMVMISGLFGPMVLADEGQGKRLQTQYQTRQGYENYPVLFSGRGSIDDIMENAMVINDRTYNFADNVTFHTPIQGNVSVSLFQKGDFVGFIRNENNEVESIWKLKSLSDLIPE